MIRTPKHWPGSGLQGTVDRKVNILIVCFGVGGGLEVRPGKSGIGFRLKDFTGLVCKKQP